MIKIISDIFRFRNNQGYRRGTKDNWFLILHEDGSSDWYDSSYIVRNGDRIIEREIIKIFIDNSKNQFTYNELKELAKSIKSDLNSTFALGIYEYGSEYDVEVHKIVSVKM